MNSALPTPRRLRLLLLALLVGASLVVASTWSVFSHTWDEPEHLASGLSLLDRFKYDYDIQHPPLGRLAMAVGPYLLGARSVGLPPPDGRPEGVAILYGEGHYHAYLVAARAGMLPFLWLLLYATFLYARHATQSEAGAVAAVACLALTPAILGNAGLATLDVPSVATTLLAIHALARWIEQGSRRRALLLGLTGGIAVATKLSAIPFLALAWPTLGLLHAWLGCAGAPPCAAPAPVPAKDTWRAGLTRRVVGVAIATGIAIVVVTLSYGGRFKYYTDHSHHFNQALYYLFGKTGRAHDLAYTVAEYVPLPEAWQKLLGGIQALDVHNRNGHLSYLLGETKLSGWWYFYVVALAVKTPLPLLVLGLAGLVCAAADGIAGRDYRRVAPLALGLVLLAFVSFYSRINIGVRHVLLLFPLLATGAGYALLRARAHARAAAGPAARVPLLLSGVLIAWLVVGFVRAYPDYLAYFNETVVHPEGVLVDSDLDWGQDLFRLERRLVELKVGQFAFAYLGTADLAREPLPRLTRLAPGERASGWIAVSALARIYAHGGYDWLGAYTPLERIGRTIDLYYIPPAANDHGGH